jgi:TolB-like protein/DNA-binding winged helix-turn-helix (wHTH) protein
MSRDSVLNFGPYRLDMGNEQLWRDIQLVRLTPKAWQVLRVLVEHPGQLVTKEEFFRVVWQETVVSDAALTSCIQELRQALGDNARNPQYIETVHRRGFRFLPPVTVQSLQSAKVQVSNQEEVASSQDSGASSQQEENQEAGGKNTRQDEGLRLQAAGPPPFSPFSLEPVASSRSQDTGLSPQHVPSLGIVRFWPSKGLALAGVVLVVGIIAVWYFALSTPSPQHPIPSTQALPLPDKPSIIVLPFVNLSGDPGQEYFSDGVTEILTTDLSKIASLFVIARNSAFTYKGKAVKVQEVSKEMGVRYVLEGSVLRADGQVRITAQLIDATTGYHLWSERYDRPLQDIFAVQDEIVQKIVTTLKLQIPLMEQGYLVRKRTDNLEAYDAFLRGIGAWHRAFSETKQELYEQAQQRFEEATDLDPQFAEAYAWLGQTYWLQWFYWPDPTLQALKQAGELAQRAIALDGSLSLPHRVLADVYVWKKQHDQAIAEGERALALDPNDAESYFAFGSVLVFAGRPEEGIGMIKQSMRLNPRYPITYLHDLGWAYRVAGRCEEAIVPLKKLLTLKPDFLPSHINLASCYAELDRMEEARAEATEILRLMPSWSLEGARRHWPYKNPADLERHLAALQKAGLK